MESNENLIKTIKDWVRIDNELRALQKELSVRKNEKTKISTMLMEVMKKNEIDCFDTKSDGQIVYAKKNIKKPITKKVLLNILSNFYEGDDVKAEELNNYILENREVTVKETISRRIANI
jgi:hypothetical protein